MLIDIAHESGSELIEFIHPFYGKKEALLPDGGAPKIPKGLGINGAVIARALSW